MNLLSVTHAEKIIRSTQNKARTVECALASSLGKILAESIVADRDQPSADRSSMDGIALSMATWKKGCREFSIEGVQKAGLAAKTLKKMTDCFEIMTGAVIPHGCDAVIPIEYVRIFDHQALVSSDAKVQRLQFVRKQGSEYKKGALLIENGIRINPTHISVAASVGKSKVKIFSPRIAVIGTGDELVELNKNPKIHQSRRSNAYALEAIFLTHGFSDVRRFHIADNLIQLQKVLKKILNHYDVLVLSGGVSMGKFDLIPKVLGELGVKTLFHKVRQKPGQPLLFAQNRHGKVIFGLPGNPVSTIVCSVRYVVPYLNKICGLNAKRSTVRLASPVQQHPSLTLFLPSQFNKNGQVAPVVFAGSGDYGALTQSAGFIEIPQGNGLFKKGIGVQFFSW